MAISLKNGPKLFSFRGKWNTKNAFNSATPVIANLGGTRMQKPLKIFKNQTKYSVLHNRIKFFERFEKSVKSAGQNVSAGGNYSEKSCYYLFAGYLHYLTRYLLAIARSGWHGGEGKTTQLSTIHYSPLTNLLFLVAA